MTAIDDLDLGEYTVDDIDKADESRGLILVGKYHVQLTGVERQAWPSGSMYDELTFTILAGEQQGRRIKEKVDEFVNNPQKDQQKYGNNKFLRFATRLGVITHAEGKWHRLKGGFEEAVGADAVVEIIHKKDKKDPTKVYANIQYCGIYTTTDPKVKDVPRGEGGKAVAATPAGFDPLTI